MPMQHAPFRILLYYNFVKIEEPEIFTQEHLLFCQELGLRGRVLIAKEGINGTVSGTWEATQHYMESMSRDPRFQNMEYKIDSSEGHVFVRLSVRTRDEIVTLGLKEPINPAEKTAPHLSPKEFHHEMQRNDVVLLDVRSNYESKLGHMRGAICPDVEHYREFPSWIRSRLPEWKDKKVLTYCTGGIRCEKIGALLLQEGLKDVAQLHGGLIAYGKDPEIAGRSFEGKCYVFDQRIHVEINRTEEKSIISRCQICRELSDRYINCTVPECHTQFFCCESCHQKHGAFCTHDCRLLFTARKPSP
jgi:UPF0176 protein